MDANGNCSKGIARSLRRLGIKASVFASCRSPLVLVMKLQVAEVINKNNVKKEATIWSTHFTSGTL